MSRFSPQYGTQNRAGELLGQGIADAVTNFISARRLAKRDREEEEDRARSRSLQDYQLSREGVHLTKPGELPPRFDVNVSGGPSPDDIISQAINPAFVPGHLPAQRAPVFDEQPVGKSNGVGAEVGRALMRGRGPSSPAAPAGGAVPPHLIAQALQQHVASGRGLQAPGAGRQAEDVSGQVVTARRDAANAAQQRPDPNALSVELSRHLDIRPSFYVDQDERIGHQQEALDAHLRQQIAAELGRRQGDELVDPGSTDRRRRLEESLIAEREGRTERLSRPDGGTPPRIVRAEEGLFLLGPDGATPLTTSDGRPLHRPLGLRGAGRGASNDEPVGHKVERQNATAVRGQLNATRSDLSAAIRNQPKRPQLFASTGDSLAYERSARDARNNVTNLRHRADSLTGVLDQITGRMQGSAPPHPSSPSASAPRPLTDRERARAASDPAFADFLRSKGYTVR